MREGDNFDFAEWLKTVRDEEAQAKHARTAIPVRDVVAARVDNPINTPGGRDLRSNLCSALIGKPALDPRALRRRSQDARSQTPKARLRQLLEKVHRAWGDFQASRRRDAVYGYLEAVFAIVDHYRVRRRTNRLLRHAFEFADLPLLRNTDSFAVVIRCTSGGYADNKTMSKWARALRYVARCKEPHTDLRKFIKRAVASMAALLDMLKVKLARKGRFRSKFAMSAFGGRAASIGQSEMSASDPKRTLAIQFCCGAQLRRVAG